MTKAHDANESYTETVKKATADTDRKNTVSGGESLIMSDAANRAIEAYDPQPHDESYLPVLTPSNPNLNGGLVEVTTVVVDADHAAGKNAKTAGEQKVHATR